MVNLSYKLNLSSRQIILLLTLAKGRLSLGGADDPDTATMKSLLAKGFAKTRAVGRRKADQASVLELSASGKSLASIVSKDAVVLAALAKK